MKVKDFDEERVYVLLRKIQVFALSLRNSYVRVKFDMDEIFLYIQEFKKNSIAKNSFAMFG